MCDYYEYSFKYRDCQQDPKHLIRTEKDVPCEKVTVENKPMCQLVNRIPWEFRSSIRPGKCLKCGRFGRTVKKALALSSAITKPTCSNSCLQKP
jgi:hypothetical protein